MVKLRGTVCGTGFPIAAEALHLELYELACTFAGSKDLARLAREHDQMGYLRDTFELSEACRRLIAVAAMVRNLDVHGEATKLRLKGISRSVGVVTPDV